MLLKDQPYGVVIKPLIRGSVDAVHQHCPAKRLTLIGLLALFFSRLESRGGVFSDLNLNGCYIAQPAGATFDPDMHCIVINGMLVNSKVVIKKISDGIEAPTIDTAAKQGIYTISGTKLNGETKDLPKGIYIVNGKKVVK